VTANAGLLLLSLAYMSGRSAALVLGLGLGGTAFFAAAGLLRARWLTYLPIVWALAMLLFGFWSAQGAADHLRVVAGLSWLTLCEVAVITAIATVFSSFSSPFLTAVFTFGVFVVGRAADTLAHLPPKVFGEAIHQAGSSLSKVVPNLMLYVPERTLLTGEAAHAGLGSYLAQATLHAAAWAAGLLAAASLIFRRRDFV
jgi:Cu-processing system permease protein